MSRDPVVPTDDHLPPEHIRLTQAAVEAGEQGRLEEAEDALRRLIDWRKASGLPQDSFTFSNLASCLLSRGRLEEALAYCVPALDAACLSGSARELGVAMTVRGQVAQANGQLDMAIADLQKAAEVLKSSGHPLDEAQALIALGGIYYMAGNREIAAPMWRKAAACLRPLGLSYQLVSVLCNLGGLLYQSGQYSDALTTLDEAQTQLPAESAGSALALQVRGNRGLALLAMQRWNEARVDLEEAVRLALAEGAYDSAAHHSSMLSRMCQELGDIDGAITYHLELMKLEREHGVSVQLPSTPDGCPTPSRISGIRSGSTHRYSHCYGPSHPVVLLVPPMWGNHGPLFPRGATSIASFLNAQSIPALVAPLSHYVSSAVTGSITESAIQQETAIRDILDSLHPRAIGISIPFTHLYPAGLGLARTIRQLDKDVPIAVGGPHVTYQDTVCLRQAPEIDVVVRGEGEWTFQDLIHAWEHHRDLGTVAGITWRTPEGEIRRNKARPVGNVLKLPDIDFALLPKDFCRRMQVTGITGRGCHYRCAYCHEFRFWGGVVRQHPVETVVGELNRLGRQYGNSMRAIDDSMLDLRTPYFIELCRQLARSPHLRDTFGLLTRIDTISIDGLHAMRQAGIKRLAVGVESGSDQVLAAMNKGITAASLRVGLEMIDQADVRVSAFLIVGHPGDTVEESSITEKFVGRQFTDELITWIDPSIFVPYPGTPFFTHPSRYGVEILSDDWSQWYRSAWPIAQLSSFSASEIQLAFLRLLALEAQYAVSQRQSSSGNLQN